MRSTLNDVESMETGHGINDAKMLTDEEVNVKCIEFDPRTKFNMFQTTIE